MPVPLPFCCEMITLECFLLVVIGQLNHLLQFLFCLRPFSVSSAAVFSVFFVCLFVSLVCSSCCAIITAFLLLKLLRNLLHLEPHNLGGGGGGHKGWKEIIVYTFCPSPPLFNVDKTRSSFHLFRSLHLTVFNHFPTLKEGRGANTYTVDITVMISCFWHFPTQIVHDCRSKCGQSTGNIETLFN